MHKNLNHNQHSPLRTAQLCVRITAYNCCTQCSTEQFW